MKLMPLRSFYCACALLCLSTPTLAETIKSKLDNGLTVIIREDHRAPVVMSQLWYRVGSVDEKVGKSGLSHALEHMMFKGTPTVPSGEFNRRISAMGGVLNAYTTATETVYHENIAKQHLPEILKMEADRMVNLNFSNQDFANEMKVIREERRMRVEDDPSGSMYEQLNQLAYDKPANQTEVIGTMADLFKLKADDLRQWYRQWYAPNNAILVIVGDVNARETLNLVQKTFGAIPARKLPSRQDISEPNIHQKGKKRLMGGNTQQAMFILAYRVPKLNKIDDKMPYALSMLVNILDGHSASRFQQKWIRGEALALALNASYPLLSRQEALLTISGMPSARSDIATLRQRIEQELALIAKEGVSEAELTRAKNQESASRIYNRDSMSSQAAIIGGLESIGFAYSDEDEIMQRLNQVSSQDIQAAARLLLQQRDVLVQLYPDQHPLVQQAKRANKAKKR